MIINFLKRNGFPKTIKVETKDETAFDNKYRTVITDESDNVLVKFRHEELRSRLQWVDGYFSALREADANAKKKLFIL